MTPVRLGWKLLLAILHFRIKLEFLRTRLRPIHAALGIRHRGVPLGDAGAATRNRCSR